MAGATRMKAVLITRKKQTAALFCIASPFGRITLSVHRIKPFLSVTRGQAGKKK
jgi:hypothetical protein